MSRQTRCRSCDQNALHEILSLGETPLANRLLTLDTLHDPEPRFPLDLVFCADCSLVQITETVPPEQLFSDYVYFSSFSDTVVANARANVESVLRRRPADDHDLIVELASNDGYLLQHYLPRGIPVLGIEPAANVAVLAEERGIPTISEFFGTTLAERLRGEGRIASVIHANNVLAHVADLNGFVAGMATLLAEDGLAVIEVPHVLDLIDHCEFDTIYHEHLCYFSVTALQALFARHGLTIVEVERIAIHGGSLRITAALTRTSPSPSASVHDLLEREEEWGVATLEPYLQFSARIERLREELTSVLRTLRNGGARIAAYGASAKGATLLNCFGIGAETLDYVVDRSTVKQGRFTPGTRLPILDPTVLEHDRPEYLLLLSWNHATEILQQQQAYRDAGGKFIIPLPRVQIV